MLATADPGSIRTDRPLPWRALARAALSPPPLLPEAGDPDRQFAEPDERIPLDSYVPPAPIRRAVQPVVNAQAWTTTHKGFPYGVEWEVNASNAQAWANHRFEGHFSERVLRLIGNPEGHPLFELRLDLLQYEVVFARFTGTPHNPLSFRLVSPVHLWPMVQAGQVEPDDLERIPARPQPWTPPALHEEAKGWNVHELRDCLQRSCRDYAEGLALYLLPGREHWGGG